MQTRDDLFDVDHSKMKQDVHDKMKELTDEQKEKMLPDQIARYEANKERITKDQDEIMEKIDNYNPFDHSTQEILDTDYDNFLFLYSCKQHEEKINAKGQTERDVEFLKAEELEKRASVGVRAKESINMYMNTLGANKKFVKFVHVIQQQLLSEKEDEAKQLNNAQLQKELDYFLSCDPNFISLFYQLQPTMEAWKKIRVYFDYYL